jgi:hypothetical protein
VDLYLHAVYLIMWCLILHRDCTFTLQSIRITKNGFSWLHKAHPTETTTDNFNSHFLRGVMSFGRGGTYREAHVAFISPILARCVPYRMTGVVKLDAAWDQIYITSSYQKDLALAF